MYNNITKGNRNVSLFLLVVKKVYICNLIYFFLLSIFVSSMNTFFFRLLLLIEVFYFSAAHCQTSIESNIGKAEEMSFQSNEIITFLRKPLRDSLHLVSQHSNYGMIDSTGEIVVPMIYDQISVNFTIRESLLWERK